MTHENRIFTLLVALAALLHDIGKATLAFQHKLASNQRNRDIHRHEWISLRLFQALAFDAPDDRTWLARLERLDETKARQLLDQVVRDGIDRPAPPPMKDLPPLAQAVGWLIVSHHRLPANPDRNGTRAGVFKRLPGRLSAAWCGETRQGPDENGAEFEKRNAQHWRFPHGTPFDSQAWCARASEIARNALECVPADPQWLDNPTTLHLARLVLMLADHHYSAGPARPESGDPGHPLYANTDDSGRRKQRLDEHLLGVEDSARRLARQLPRLRDSLPRIARHEAFTRRTTDPRFAWQDMACDLAAGLRQRAREHGFFGVNMASTGRGKTIANGRILYALADPERGARFSIALGLRTLTLQTGDACRERLGLGPEHMAVRVGGGAVRELHEIRRLADQGSESREHLLDDFVHYGGDLESGPLSQWLDGSPEAQKLLAAPILVSTIDHLMSATESTRGGHQIAPMLRLLTSDLVLDEPDDFDLADIPALTRLVHRAGMLGSNVLLSSATLPPALVRALFDAWRAGRAAFQRFQGGTNPSVNPACAWFDEFGGMSGDCPDTETFSSHHQRFVQKRLEGLTRAQQKRRARILSVDIPAPSPQEDIHPAWAAILRDAAGRLHADHHVVDPVTGKRLSCGLIRMAHIRDIIATARELLRLGAHDNQRIHLCVYHSRHPLLMRSAIEEILDRLLRREDGDARLFRQPEIRALLDRHDEPDQLFIVLASPVTEVGRDHDYDWAIIEPSSIRSLIQLAGRIRRHRGAPGSDASNIALAQFNLTHLRHGMSRPAFCRPGFETTLAGTDRPLLNSHDLRDLITDDQLGRIDASARICERESLRPRDNLADLEHARLRALTGDTGIEGVPDEIPVTHGYETRAHLVADLQNLQPFRGGNPGVRYCLGVEDDKFTLTRIDRDGSTVRHSDRLCAADLPESPGVQPFGVPDYRSALESLARRTGLDLPAAAQRFGVVDLPDNGDRERLWRYHPSLGFFEDKQGE